MIDRPSTARWILIWASARAFRLFRISEFCSSISTWTRACNRSPKLATLLARCSSRCSVAVQYDVDAPRTWDFNTYNGRTDLIKAFLRENRARETYIPYHENRCIIFNSDLFHGTHEVHFKPGFENHRINVTMLYGHREDDTHHLSMTGRPDLKAKWGMECSAWRSLAFTRNRM